MFLYSAHSIQSIGLLKALYTSPPGRSNYVVWYRNEDKVLVNLVEEDYSR